MTKNTNRRKFDFTMKIIDTIPSGEEFDPEENEDPIDTNQFFALYLEKEDDKKRTAGMMKKGQREITENFEIEYADDSRMDTSDFEGCVGGIVVKHEHKDKDDPESIMVARVTRTCPL